MTPVPVFVPLTLCCDAGVCQTYTWPPGAREAQSGAGAADQMKVKVKSLSRVDSATPWTVAHQAPLSMGFSRQEYWGGLLFPSPGDLYNPGIEPGSAALQAGSLLSEPKVNHKIIQKRVVTSDSKVKRS